MKNRKSLYADIIQYIHESKGNKSINDSELQDNDLQRNSKTRCERFVRLGCLAVSQFFFWVMHVMSLQEKELTQNKTSEH